MACYSNINITIRRKDRTPVTIDDLQHFEEHCYENLQKTGIWDDPHICTDGCSIHASFQIYHTLEEEDILEFSRRYPELQIEVIEECDDCDVGNTRYLFEGNVCEMLCETKCFERPQIIDWPDSVSPYGKLLNNSKFLNQLGYHIICALQDMMDNTTSKELGEYVIESLANYPLGEDMFSAVVGWAIDDLIARANDSLEEREEHK